MSGSVGFPCCRMKDFLGYCMFSLTVLNNLFLIYEVLNLLAID